eukprot:12285699-Alexandrium_andersonii.AAC.1
MHYLRAEATADQPGQCLRHGVARLPFTAIEVFPWTHRLGCTQAESTNSRGEPPGASRDLQEVYRAFVDPALDVLR